MNKIKKSISILLIALCFSQFILISCGQGDAEEIFEDIDRHIENSESETDEEDEKKQKAWTN